MKRKCWAIICVLILSCIFMLHTVKKDAFQIYNSMKVGTKNYTSVNLQVVVNKWFYDASDIFDAVYDLYYQNDVPNKLTINLYDSVKDLENGNYKASRCYEKE